MDRKGCPAAKCRLLGHVERDYLKLKKASTNNSTRSIKKHYLIIFTTKGHLDNLYKVTHQFRQSKRSGRANPTQPKTMPHLIWNGTMFQKGPLQLPLSLAVEVTLILEFDAKFRYTPTSLDSLYIHRIIAIADTEVQTCSSRSKIQKILKCSDKTSCADQSQNTWHNGWPVIHKRLTIHAYQGLLKGKVPDHVCIGQHLNFTYLSQQWQI